MNTVSGGASDVLETILSLPDIDGGIEGQGIGFGTVVVFWCDDLNLSHGFQRLVQGDNAWGQISVVIGNQNSHAHPV
jgi:hypothetical protein